MMMIKEKCPVDIEAFVQKSSLCRLLFSDRLSTCDVIARDKGQTFPK